MVNKVFLKKLKHKILHEFNINLYKKFNMTIAEIDSLFGYYNGHIFELVDHIYRRYGPHGLRKKKHILEYLEFLMNKLKIIIIFPLKPWLIITLIYIIYLILKEINYRAIKFTII